MRIPAGAAREAALHRSMATAFPAELKEEEAEQGLSSIDGMHDDAYERMPEVVAGERPAELDEQLIEDIPQSRKPCELI